MNRSRPWSGCQSTPPAEGYLQFREAVTLWTCWHLPLMWQSRVSSLEPGLAYAFLVLLLRCYFWQQPFILIAYISHLYLHFYSLVICAKGNNVIVIYYVLSVGWSFSCSQMDLILCLSSFHYSILFFFLCFEFSFSKTSWCTPPRMIDSRLGGFIRNLFFKVLGVYVCLWQIVHGPHMGKGELGQKYNRSC